MILEYLSQNFGEYIILLLSIIWHEIGHYIFYRVFGYRPKLGFTWWGCIYIGDDCANRMRPDELAITALAGIHLGLVYLWLFNVSYDIVLVYLLMSCVDITTIIRCLGIEKRYRHLSMIEIAKNEVEDYVSKM